MGFVVSSLAEYINQESTNLIPRLYFEGRTQKHVNFQVGVKHKEALQLLDVTAWPQANSCSPSASGNVTFTQRTITVGDILYYSSLCPKDLKAKWTQKLLRQGARPEMEGLSFEAEIAENIISLIQENNEKAIWQGDTTSGDPVLSKFDGLIKLIDAAGTATAGNTGSAGSISATATDATNAVTIVNAMIDARPQTLKTAPNQVLFCGTDTFDKWVTAQIKANNFHIDATSYANYEVNIPGKNVMMVGVHGLDSTNRMFLGQADNFFIGTDGMNDAEVFDAWYSKDDRKIYWNVEYKMGTQVARPAEIVQFTVA